MIRRITLTAATVLVALGAFPASGQAPPVVSCHPSSTTLCVDPISWNIIGLDSNKATAPQNQGPDTFMVGARACNYTTTTLTGITATYNTLGTINPHLNLADNSTLTISELKPGRCEDFYFNGQITRTTAAYNTSQQYQITVRSTAPSALVAATPLNRELYIEKLIEQNRNSVGTITGPTDLQVGGIYTFNVQWSTATGGYEQLEHFVNLANTNFRLLSSYSEYATPIGETNTTIYADACGWDNNILSATYRSCIGPANYAGGKAGGAVNTYFTVQILGATPAGGSRLKALIYDFSGSSYHYNTDFNSGTQGLVVNASAAADLAVTITDTPDPVQPGGTITYSGVVTNNGLSTLTTTDGGKLTIPIPPGTTLSTAPVMSGWNCTNPTGNAIECSPNSPMVKGATASYSFQVTVGAGATGGSIIPATATISSNLQDSVPANNTATTTTTVILSTQADLVVTNTVPAVVQQGSNFSFTQTVTNVGPAAAANPTFTTQVPAGTTFTSIVWPLGWTCGAPVSGSITCSKSSPMAPGEVASFSLNLNASGAAGTITSSTAYAQTSTPEPSTSNNVATATTGIIAPNTADLAITVSDFPDPVVAGETILYTQTVKNNGLIPATNVVVTFPTPPNTTYSYIDFPAGWTCSTYPLPGTPTPGSAGTITCTKPTMGVGETASFPLTVTVGAATPNGTPIDYTATVSSATTDSILSNNTSSAQTLVGAATGADVEVVKTASANPITTGANLVYTLRVTNNGPATATDVVVTDPLPSNLTFVAPAVTSKGTCGYNAGTRTVSCTIGTLNVGATAVVTIRTTVDAAASGLPLNNTATVTGLQADPRPTNNSSPNQTIVLSATAAKLFDADAIRRDGKVELAWSTSYEIDNIGFNVYRESGTTRTNITPSLIAGSTLITGAPLTAGFSYKWIDESPVDGAVYWLEDVELDGTRTFHGPIVPHADFTSSARRSSKTDGVMPSPTLEDLGQAPAAARTLTVGPSLLVSRGEAMPADVIRAKQFEIAASQGAKILVRDDGWYRVTRTSLAAAGFDPGADPRALQLFVDGEELPIAVSDGGDGRWDASDFFEFYAVGMDTTYSGTRAYWLLAGNNGQRYKPKSKTKPAPINATSFSHTMLRKDRFVYFSAQTNNSDRDSFYGPVLYTSPVTQSFDVTNLDASGTGASLEVAIQGATYTAHRVRVQLNGIDLGMVDFNGQETGFATFPIPVSSLRAGRNDVVLLSMLGPSDVSFLDYIRLTYPHTYSADGNRLHFTMQGARQARITGFTTSDIRAIDVTNPLQPEEVETSVVSEGGAWTLVVSPHEKGDRAIYATAASLSRTPVSIAANIPSTLSSQHNRADFVVITDPQFSTALQPLIDKRRDEGLETEVVSVEDVFDEFGFGAKSPFAIRDFLSFATQTWKLAPRYVLLVGDATFDPRNYIGYGPRDLVPTRIIPTKYMKTASDDWLVDFDGDGVQDIFVGRLSVATTGDAEAAVQKIVNYAPPASKRVLQVIDLNDKTYSFDHAAALARTAVPSDFTIEQFPVTSASTARAALLAAIKRGPTFVNYFGHGSIEGWSNTNVFRSQDMPSLAGTGVTPIYLMMDCLNGYFHDVWSYSLAEALIRTPNGGAVAVWASTGLSDPPAQSDMVNAFWRILGENPSLTLGEATTRAKQSTRDPEVRKTWILLGDPTMRLSN